MGSPDPSIFSSGSQTRLLLLTKDRENFIVKMSALSYLLNSLGKEVVSEVTSLCQANTSVWRFLESLLFNLDDREVVRDALATGKQICEPKLKQISHARI